MDNNWQMPDDTGRQGAMVYTWEELKKAYIAGRNFKFLFFWGHTPSADGHITQACLSQWWKCSFTVDGTMYSCAE